MFVSQRLLQHYLRNNYTPWLIVVNFIPSLAPSYGNEEIDHLNNSEFFQLRAWMGVMVHTCNFIIWEVEAGGSEFRGKKIRSSHSSGEKVKYKTVK